MVASALLAVVQGAKKREDQKGDGKDDKKKERWLVSKQQWFSAGLESKTVGIWTPQEQYPWHGML
jgi:hypothetical protein